MSFPSDQFDVVIVAMALMLVADPYTSLNGKYSSGPRKSN